MMFSDRPPARSPGRAALVPGLSYCAGDIVAGRYRLVSLSREGHACAYAQAIELAKNTMVDLQIVLPPSSASRRDVDGARFRFLNAAGRATRLSSPNLARVIDAGLTSENLPYVVREALSPRTLATLLEEQGSLPTHDAVAIARDLCAALAEAHSRGMLHGEIAAHFVHLEGKGSRPAVKLSDLGTAHALAALPDAPSAERIVLRAPEAARAIDARADVWGVGVLLYTMLAGGPPFAAGSPSALEAAIAREDPPSLAGVPDGLAEIVDACLAKDPSRRPSTIAALSASLAQFAVRPLLQILDESNPTLVKDDVAIATMRELVRADVSSDPDATAPQDAETRARLLDLLAETAPLPTLAPPPVRAAKTLLPPASALQFAPAPRRVPAPPPPAASSTPSTQKPSVPPVVLTRSSRDERTIVTPRRKRRWQAAGAAAAAAAIAAALVLVFEGPAVVVALRGAPPAKAPDVGAPARTALAAAAPPQVTPAPEATPVDALPAAKAPPVTAPRPYAPSAPAAHAKTHVEHAAASATHAAPEPSAAPSAAPEPPKTREAEPPPPEPKKDEGSDDDDLRKFLDDRR